MTAAMALASSLCQSCPQPTEDSALCPQTPTGFAFIPINLTRLSCMSTSSTALSPAVLEALGKHAHHSLVLPITSNLSSFMLWGICPRGTCLTALLLQINLERRLLRNSGPAKGLVQQGVAAVAMAPSGDIIVGGGDGTVSIMKHDQEGQDARFLNKMPLLATTKLGSKISTLVVDHAHSSGRAMSMICGTYKCDKFRVTYDIQVHQTAPSKGCCQIVSLWL